MAEKESRLLNYFRSNEELQNAVDRKDERITILLRHNKDLETDIVYREKLMEENTSRLIINLKHAKQRNGRLEKEKKIIEKRHKKSMNALQKELDYMKSAHAGPAHNRVPVSPETNGPPISHRNNSTRRRNKFFGCINPCQINELATFVSFLKCRQSWQIRSECPMSA
eukprot:167931_1